MSNLHYHAMAEFRAAGFIDENGNYCDEMQAAVCKNILKMLEVFTDEGHSGFSASYTVNMFSKLAMFQPLTPLTGEDWEWNEVSEGVFQNKRCSHVFKQADRYGGQAYDIDGKVFWSWRETEEFGALTKDFYSNSDCFTPITFPYTPKREVVFVPTEKFPDEEIRS